MTLMAVPLIVQTVTGRSMAELLAARDAADVGDLVELRLDGVGDVDVRRALQDRRRPVVVTCRPRWEGGQFDGSEEERRRILRTALDAGAEYVDVEWRAGFSDIVGAAPARTVVSSHDFDGVPSDLADRAAAMRQTGAGVIKIAVTARRLCDALPLRPIAAAGRAVVIAMGDAGVATRILASRFGSVWTYAGRAVAPGQIPGDRLISEFRFRAIGPRTAVYGVVGNNVAHSLSPLMHNAAFGATGIDAVYVPLLAADMDDFLAFADAMDIQGASVTMPYKVDALTAASRADALTRRVGAANTLRRAAGGGWDATNTDVGGFLDALHAAYDGAVAGARVAVLGAGGAVRAVVVGLVDAGAAVTLYARRVEQARAVATDCGGEVGDGAVPTPGSWDILVNGTPLGGPGRRDASPWPDGTFDGRLVYDLTYGSVDAPLLQEARAAGCEVLDGFPMLVAQAERQYHWWTGRPAPAGVMRAAAEPRARG